MKSGISLIVSLTALTVSLDRPPDMDTSVAVALLAAVAWTIVLATAALVIPIVVDLVCFLRYFFAADNASRPPPGDAAKLRAPYPGSGASRVVTPADSPRRGSRVVTAADVDRVRREIILYVNRRRRGRRRR